MQDENKDPELNPQPEEGQTGGEQEQNAENQGLSEEAKRKKRKRGNRGGQGGSQNDEALEAELQKTAGELAEMKDKYLRLYAEFDNYRKRTNKEREELTRTAAQGTIKAILPSLDDFERAIKAGQEGHGEPLPEGVVLIFEKFVRSLEQLGLKAIESTNQPFDADLHEAITRVPSPSEDFKGKVLDTVEKGYYLQDKIIRYAKVVVAQ